MELHENHERDGGQEFESSEEARAAMEEERIEEQIEDPSVLLNPTELKGGGVGSGESAAPGDVGNSGGAQDGGSLPGNSGDAAQPTSGNSGDAGTS